LDYWPVRRRHLNPNRFIAQRWGRAVDLIILDTRQYRAADRSFMLGHRQKEWFFDRLASSNATFKFVGTTIPWLVAVRGSLGWISRSAPRYCAISSKKIPAWYS
jgi:phosphodiesterase/alkaline phosphatase D-like protein